MFNQHRIYRIFQLINTLKKLPAKSTRTLASLIDVSERSVYRYLDLLETLGFNLLRDESGRFYLEAKEAEGIPFSAEEIKLLNSVVKPLANSNALAQSILDKILLHSEHETAARSLYESNISYLIDQITQAVKDKKQIRIINYYSARSETISDRIVEPVQFTENYESISAFELKSKSNKYFNIQRMSDVEILPRNWKHESLHIFYQPDIFGFQGTTMDKEVHFSLSLRACLLLKEEFPLAKAYLSSSETVPNLSLELLYKLLRDLLDL